jgi:hypothetical protein
MQYLYDGNWLKDYDLATLLCVVKSVILCRQWMAIIHVRVVIYCQRIILIGWKGLGHHIGCRADQAIVHLYRQGLSAQAAGESWEAAQSSQRIWAGMICRSPQQPVKAPTEDTHTNGVLTHHTLTRVSYPHTLEKERHAYAKKAKYANVIVNI